MSDDPCEDVTLAGLSAYSPVEIFRTIGNHIYVNEPEPVLQDSPMALLIHLSRANCYLWKLEDEVRQSIRAYVIAGLKHRIDYWNLRRSHWITELDARFESMFRVSNDAICRDPNGEIPPLRYSETPGSMLDRLCILRIKQYVIGLNSQGDESATKNALNRLRGQIDHLVLALNGYQTWVERGLVIPAPGGIVKQYHSTFVSGDVDDQEKTNDGDGQATSSHLQ